MVEFIKPIPDVGANCNYKYKPRQSIVQSSPVVANFHGKYPFENKHCLLLVNLIMVDYLEITYTQLVHPMVVRIRQQQQNDNK